MFAVGDIMAGGYRELDFRRSGRRASSSVDSEQRLQDGVESLYAEQRTEVIACNDWQWARSQVRTSTD